MLGLAGILRLVLVLPSTRAHVGSHCEPVAGFSVLGHIVSLTTPILSHIREQRSSHEMSRFGDEEQRARSGAMAPACCPLDEEDV